MANSTVSQVQLPGERADTSDPVSAQLFNTGAFAAGPTVHFAEWQNQTGQRLRIVKAAIWIGVSVLAKLDVGATLYRGDGSTILHCHWDHYAEPTGLHQLCYDFAYPMALEPGEKLALHYYAVPIDPNQLGQMAHAIATIWALRL